MNDRILGIVPRVLTMLAIAALAQAQDAQILQPGVAAERSIRAQEQHRFQLAVTPGELVKVTVDQYDADVGVELTFAGSPAVTVDESEKRRYGRELLLWVAPAAGSAQIIVKAGSAGDPGRYRALATVSPPDERAANAVALLGEALRAQPHEGEATRNEPGVPRFQRALDAWREIGDREVIAACLYGLGMAERRNLQRPADAIATLDEALAIYTALGLDVEVVQTLQQMGLAQQKLAHPDLALAAFERAYEHGPHIDPLNRAVIEDDIGHVCQDTGDLDRAAAFSRRAADTFHAAGARRDEFVSLERLSNAYMRLRRFDDAQRAITDAVALGRQYGRPLDLVSLTLSAARIEAAVGDEESALRHFREVVDRATDMLSLRLVALLSMGRIYNARRDTQQARDVLEKGLAAVPPQQTDLWAAFASEVGIALTEQGEPARALPLQTRALEIVQGGSAAGQISVLRGIAATYRAMGDPPHAEAAIERAAGIIQALPGQPAQAILLREEALNARAAGNLALARARLDEALDVIDSERGRLQSQPLRTAFGATAVDYYADAIDIEMEMHAAAPGEGHDARAFELFERSRARSLTDLLAEARVDLRTGIDPALLDEQKALQKQLGDKDTVLRDLAGQPGARDRAAALGRDIDELARKLAVLDGRVRAASPRYASLTRPSPLSVHEAQQLLDDDTVLLAFALGAHKSWGWALTRESIESFALPPAAEINQRARRVYASLTARQRRPDAARIPAIDRDFEAAASALSRAILAPIAVKLNSAWRTRRLAIVATGALEYVQFAALPVPSSGAHGRRLLIEQHEIVRLPSVSTLALLRSEPERHSTAAAGIAVFADPVFSADDPRVAAKAAAVNGQSAAAVPLLRGTDEETVRAGFARLVFSRDEANAIAEFARPHVLEALDFTASLHTLSTPAVSRARIVHIASHGILNSARPELSGLVLSLVDSAGRPQEGILRLYDVFNLTLSADLVVLSGCQTGLGREMKGEGLVGLTRGFMHAGARRVMASLWQVDDRATAELMRSFYRGILVHHLRPAAALAAAERQMRADPRWRAPYYWAAFTLVGDWK